MKVAVDALMPRIAPGVSFASHDLGSKSQFMKKAPGRLRGYAYELGANPSLAVLLLRDRDQEDCRQITESLKQQSTAGGLTVASVALGVPGNVVVRLADEMLEAWFFGDGQALNRAYPRVPAALTTQRAYRHPDAIRDPARRLEGELQRRGYHQGGLSKTALASAVAPLLDVEANTSVSFVHFRDAVRFLSPQPLAHED